MPFSIRRRLLIALLLLTFISWSTIAVINYFHERNAIKELFDAHLIQSAKVLLSLVNQELYEEYYEADSSAKEEHLSLNSVEEHLESHKYEKLLAFQISVSKENFSFASAMAPKQPLSDKTNGFSDSTIDNTDWRVYTLQDPQGIITIRVAEPHSVRDNLINEITFNLLIPLLIGLPIISILIWQSVGMILKPLDRIAADIQQRNSSQLDPVTTYDVPSEIHPLINALNRLFYRLDKVLKNERRFTADASHELRTPLAGLKTQAQIALRTEDKQKRDRALKNIMVSVDRATHLVEQLLTLARLEPDVEYKPKKENCNLTRLIQDILADVSPLAIDKNITLQFDGKKTIQILADYHIFSILLRNLLDNAIRYTPAGGQVDVHLFEDATGVTVRIADNGPGIPWEFREDVFKRFYRPEDTRESGSGLGLSIVKRIADLHHAVIHLDESSSNGLQVDIRFSGSALN